MSGTSYVVVEVGEDLVGLDVLQVREVLAEQPLTRVALAPPDVVGLLHLRGQVVTTLDLRRRLGLAPGVPAGRATDVVVRVGDERVALRADGVRDVVHVEDADVEPVADVLPHPLSELARGAVQLPGRLLLLLDVARTASPGAAA